MKTLKQSFDFQCHLASITAAFEHLELHVVIVRQQGYLTRISILGNAIGMCTYNEWRAGGSQVRLLRIYGPDGQITDINNPTRDHHD